MTVRWRLATGGGVAEGTGRLWDNCSENASPGACLPTARCAGNCRMRCVWARHDLSPRPASGSAVGMSG